MQNGLAWALGQLARASGPTSMKLLSTEVFLPPALEWHVFYAVRTPRARRSRPAPRLEGGLTPCTNAVLKPLSELIARAWAPARSEQYRESASAQHTSRVRARGDQGLPHALKAHLHGCGAFGGSLCLSLSPRHYLLDL